jgi:FtsZ-interacting cell division protein ZipA
VNSTTLIWIVVAIIAVLVIAGIIIALVTTARGRREHRMEVQHTKAEEMRNDARETAIRAQQHEAEAARARADAAAAAAAAEDAKARAAQASVDAERRSGAIDDHQTEAEKLREQEAATRRKADETDPYVNGGGTTTADGRPVGDRTVDDTPPAATRATRAGQDTRAAQQAQNERAAVSNNPPPDVRTS